MHDKPSGVFHKLVFYSGLFAVNLRLLGQALILKFGCMAWLRRFI